MMKQNIQTMLVDVGKDTLNSLPLFSGKMGKYPISTPWDNLLIHSKIPPLATAPKIAVCSIDPLEYLQSIPNCNDHIIISNTHELIPSKSFVEKGSTIFDADIGRRTNYLSAANDSSIGKNILLIVGLACIKNNQYQLLDKPFKFNLMVGPTLHRPTSILKNISTGVSIYANPEDLEYTRNILKGMFILAIIAKKKHLVLIPYGCDLEFFNPSESIVHIYRSLCTEYKNYFESITFCTKTRFQGDQPDDKSSLHKLYTDTFTN
jgi:hypothetical protein